MVIALITESWVSEGYVFKLQELYILNYLSDDLDLASLLEIY